MVVITHVGDLARMSFPCPLSISYIKECHLIIPVLNPLKTPHTSDRVRSKSFQSVLPRSFLYNLNLRLLRSLTSFLLTSSEFIHGNIASRYSLLLSAMLGVCLRIIMLTVNVQK
ncbi:hypothetical protein J3E68DRAFT_248015 [Trichoderma sp. SZMC 28012]